MKVAVTSTGNSLDSEVSSVFGRCPYFIIADMENGEIKGDLPIENPAKNERGGAGIKAAQFIANSEVKALISGAVGPNAFDILKQVGIKVYKLESGSVKDNLKFFSEGKLEEITSSTSGGPRAGGRGPGRRGGMGQRR
jgi:predicted Fe-Mo cluster-binding NifX family protein